MLSFKQYLTEKKIAMIDPSAVIKGLGFDVVKSGRTYTIKTDADRIDSLKKLAKQFKGKYNPKGGASSIGRTEFSGGFILAKPKTSGGSGAGAAATKLGEAAQCLYCAAAWLGKSFSKTDLRQSTSKIDTDENLNNILTKLTPDWQESSILIANLLHSKFKSKQYTFHRGSSWVNKLEKHWLKLNRAEKLFANLNKWSPADIYMVSATGNRIDVTKTQSLLELNSVMKDALIKKDIIGVSLKKAKNKASMKFINMGPPPTYEYTGYSLGLRGFFKAKDVYIDYEGGRIQYRTFPTWQGEIKGKNANQGKISGGPTHAIVKRLTNVDMIKQKDVDSSDKNIALFYKFYAALETHPITKAEFMSELIGKDLNWFQSKFLGTQLIYYIYKSKKQDAIISNFIGYASSQSEMSGPFVKAE